MEKTIILFALPVFWVALVEFATTYTLGNHFIRYKSKKALLDELKFGWLNSMDNKIICLHANSEIRAKSICDSCSSIRSRYYVSTSFGDYRVYRYSKLHYLIKLEFKQYSKKRPKL